MVKPLYKTGFNCRAWVGDSEVYFYTVSYVWPGVEGQPRHAWTIT
jgi:hypothetical protein